MNKIIILVLTILFSTLTIGCNFNNTGDNNNTNGKEKLNTITLDTQTIDGIKISGFNIQYNNDTNKIVATVTNTNNNDYYIQAINIILRDKDNNVVHETFGLVRESLKPGASKNIVTFVPISLVGVVKAEFSIKQS
jgi:hypothetical protein